MARPRSRTLLLEEGLRLLSVQGLDGVTLGTLARAGNRSKSGLFAHFKSKTALQTALLDQMAAVAQVSVVAPAMAAPEGLPRLRALIEEWFGWPPRAGLPGGCPLAAALFEFDDLDGPVRDHVATLEKNWRDFLLGLTEQAKAAGHLRAGTDSAQFVWELCGLYLSHHVSVRFQRDGNADRHARIAVAALVGRHTTQTPPL